MNTNNSRTVIYLIGGAIVTFITIIAVPFLLLGSCADTDNGASFINTSMIDKTLHDSLGDLALNEQAIPDPALVPWIQQAGSLCTAITPPLIAAQIQQESSWDPTAVSPKGAQGLAQFMPGTWPTYGRDDDDTGQASPFDPADAIMAQGRYMCALVDTVLADDDLAGQDLVSLALASYNAGPNRVIEYQGIPPFPETQDYIAEIRGYYDDYAAGGTTSSTAHDPKPLTAAGNSTALGLAILQIAQTQQGLPYVWAGGSLTGPTDGGFDCSGLTRYAVYQASGGAVTLPRVSRDQGRTQPGVVEVDPRRAQIGDLIAFKFDNRNGTASTDWDHIGIVSAVDANGPTQMFHAPETGKTLGYADLTTPFYTDHPHAVFRIQPPEG